MRAVLPRTLLARNIALLVILVFVTQACSLFVLLHYVQRPRVQRLVTGDQGKIVKIRTHLAVVATDEAAEFLARPTRRERLSRVDRGAEPGAALQGSPEAGQRRRTLEGRGAGRPGTGRVTRGP